MQRRGVHLAGRDERVGGAGVDAARAGAAAVGGGERRASGARSSEVMMTPSKSHEPSC